LVVEYVRVLVTYCSIAIEIVTICHLNKHLNKHGDEYG